MRMNSARWVVIIYSLVVTGLLVGTFFIFSGALNIPQNDIPDYFFAMGESDVVSSLQGAEQAPVLQSTTPFIIQKSGLEAYYQSSLTRNFPYLIAGFVLILIAGTIVLSVLLSRQQQRQSLLLATQLRRLDDDDAMSGQHPAIAEAYREIRGRLEANAQDYIRLNAYVTHEQKNILTLLRAKLQLAGNAELTADVDRVTESLDDILTLSSAKNIGNTERVDAALICADICDEFCKAYPSLRFDFSEDLNTAILARELWLRRAISNLIGNAVKHANSGAVDVVVTNRKGSVILSVSDEGPGLDESEQEKLFDHQHRIGRLKKDGYGIGLSLVRHVCDLCGGVCWVDSQRGKGTVFYMVFPEAPADESLNDK